MTEAGMRGIDDDEGTMEDASAGDVPFAAFVGDIDRDRVDVGCADVEYAGQGNCAVVAVCCEVAEGSSLTVGAASFLNAKGADVSGGGSGVPFGSPRTLRFKGGSSATAVFPFLPPILESLPPPVALVAARASCSSNMRSQSASTVQ